MILGATSLVANTNPYQSYQTVSYSSEGSPNGLAPYYYRCRNCDTNLTTNTPASQYQRLKLIQKTVRVPSSVYTMNLAGLTAYRPATEATQYVCWNQMSDRPLPSVQKATIPTGFYTSSNRRHTSVTSSRPGTQTPGGKGVDIKHNSYERRLNRLKGKAALRRGVIPPEFGAPQLPFNRAYPIYGAKTTKTSIINGCNCPIGSTDAKAYEDPYYQGSIYDVKYRYYVSQEVYAQEIITGPFKKATIIAINENGTLQVEFEDKVVETKGVNEVLPYFPCDCVYTSDNIVAIPTYDENGNLSICELNLDNY